MNTRHRTVSVGTVLTQPVIGITDLLYLATVSLNGFAIVIIDSGCIGSGDGCISFNMSFYQCIKGRLDGFFCSFDRIGIGRFFIYQFLCICNRLIKCFFGCFLIGFSLCFFCVIFDYICQNFQLICFTGFCFYHDVIQNRVIACGRSACTLYKDIQGSVGYRYFIFFFEIFGGKSGLYFLSFQNDIFCFGSPLAPWVIDTYGNFVITFRYFKLIFDSGFSCFIGDLV